VKLAPSTKLEATPLGSGFIDSRFIDLPVGGRATG
jgi:hypothetical protein